MIVVAAPAPALDRIAVVDYRPKQTLRPLRSFEWPGGSGVHAAHVARRFGAPVHVVALVGGHDGERFARLARADGLLLTSVDVPSETRSTFSLIDREHGNMFDVAEPAPVVDPSDIERFRQVVLAALADAALLIVSGSLPSGADPELYGRLIASARERGVRAIADLTGDALEASIAHRPWLIKPSLEELQRDGLVDDSAASVLERARAWVDRGVTHVCVSLADAGALWVSMEGARRIGIASAPAYNTIGCGDTLVGALASAVTHGDTVEDAIRTGVAAATVNLRHDEPGEASPEEARALFASTFVEEVDEHRLASLLDRSAPTKRVSLSGRSRP